MPHFFNLFKWFPDLGPTSLRNSWVYLLAHWCLGLTGYPLYNLTLALQMALYALAFAGYLWQRKGKPPCILGITFAFCLVNLAALVGVARFVVGRKAGRWEPVR